MPIFLNDEEVKRRGQAPAPTTTSEAPVAPGTGSLAGKPAGTTVFSATDPRAPKPVEQTAQKKETWSDKHPWLRKVADAFTEGTQKFADTLGTTAAVVTGEAKKINEAKIAESETRLRLSKLLNDPNVTETQKKRIRKQLGVASDLGVASETLPSINKTPKQILGEGVMFGAELLSGGALESVGKTAAKGVAKTAAKEGTLSLMKQAGKTGFVYGSATSAGRAMEQDKGIVDIAKDAVTGGVTGAALAAATVPIAKLVGAGVQKGAKAIRDVKSGRAKQVLAELDTATANVLDPTYAARAAKDVGIDVADEALKVTPDKVEQARQSNERFEYYLSKAKRAAADAQEETPLEFAGKRAEEALGTLTTKLQRNGKLKQEVLAEVGHNTVQGVGSVKQKLQKNLADRVGAQILTEADDVMTSIVEGKSTVANAPGRVSKISLDPADQKLVKDVYALIDNLDDDADTIYRIDGTVDAIQDVLYKRKQAVATPVNSAVEGVLKDALGELNGMVKKAAGPTYRKANARYAATVDLRDRLNKALGLEGSKGGSLMKRVFSPTDSGTKKMFEAIHKATGINLVDEAVLAKFAMQEVGDTRQMSLLESLDLIKQGPKGWISKVLEKSVKTVLNKEKIARKISERASQR